MANISTTMASGGLAAAVTVIIITEFQRYGVTIDADEAAAIGTVLGTALHYATRWLPKDPVQPAPAAPQGETTNVAS